MVESLWDMQGAAMSFAPVTEDREVGVVVIGAGIAGLLVATELERSGHDVLVLDRARVGGVATRNTTAKVSALQGTTLQRVLAARGQDAATDYAMAQLDAVSAIRGLVAELGIECELTPDFASTYATEPQAAARVDRELRAAQAAGLPVRRQAHLGLPFPVLDAVVLDDQFHMHPGKLCQALARRLGAGRVAEETVVTVIDEDRSGCRVETETGRVVRADHVVLATQLPVVDPGLLANRTQPHQSYCLAGRLETPVPQGMHLSCDRTTISLRPAAVGDGEGIIVGGAGHPMGSSDARRGRWDQLERWARDNLGELEVTHRWATHDPSSTDRVPFIGRLHRGSRRRFVAAAFGKWGMTNSWVAADLLRRAIDGSPSPRASTFDSTRVRSTIINRRFAEAGATAMHHLVIDRLARRPEPRCTHQGCVLRHDDALDTWDCPCHGSRFAADGTALQGPAVRSCR
jgi:glycine/D-amino acid oxidase-like deaminating enzyme